MKPATLCLQTGLKPRIFGPRPAHVHAYFHVPRNFRLAQSPTPLTASVARGADGHEQAAEHLVSANELEDGSVIFSFGTKEEAEAASAEAGEQGAPERGGGRGKGSGEGRPRAARRKGGRRRAEPLPRSEVPSPDGGEGGASIKGPATAREPRQRRRAAAAREAGRRGQRAPEAAAAQSAPEAAVETEETEEQREGALPESTGDGRGSGAAGSNGAAPDLHSLKVAELRALAKERSLRGYSRLKKAELVALLESA